MNSEFGDMQKFEVKKVAGPIEGGAAIFLASKDKAFVVFVGLFEATAIIKEMQKQSTIRPLTHDLLHNILLGFDIEIKRIIISKIVDNTFCATLVLEQKVVNSDGKWTGQRNEVHIDARASDSIVMALKTGKEIWVTRDVYDKVENVAEQLEMANEAARHEEERDIPWKDTNIDQMDLDMPEDPDDTKDNEQPPM